jgi:hypothetical protein
MDFEKTAFNKFSRFLLTLGLYSNSPLQCRREGGKPVQITGVVQSGMGLGPRTCRICFRICQLYFSIVKINSFRSSPSHSTTGSQSSRFSLNIFSLSAMSGGPTHISLGPEAAPFTHINHSKSLDYCEAYHEVTITIIPTNRGTGRQEESIENRPERKQQYST